MSVAGNSKSDFRKLLRGIGWREGTATRGELAKRLWTRDDLQIYEAPREPRDLSLAGAEIVLASRDNLRDVVWFQEPEYVQIFSRFLDEGQAGYFVYMQGRCVHRSWLVKGPATVREHWSQSMEIDREQGFVHYCETAPMARGLGVFPYVLSQIAADHPALSITMSIDQKNTPSQRAATKAGWKHIESVTYSVIALRRASRRRSNW